MILQVKPATMPIQFFFYLITLTLADNSQYLLSPLVSPRTFHGSCLKTRPFPFEARSQSLCSGGTTVSRIMHHLPIAVSHKEWSLLPVKSCHSWIKWRASLCTCRLLNSSMLSHHLRYKVSHPTHPRLNMWYWEIKITPVYLHPPVL